MKILKNLFGNGKKEIKKLVEITEVENYKIEVELNNIIHNASKMNFEVTINNEQTCINSEYITTYTGKRYLISNRLKKEIEMIEKFNNKEISLLDLLSNLSAKDLIRYKHTNIYNSLMNIKHHAKTQTNLNKTGLILF